MCSAYQNSNGQWVAVVINYSENPQRFALQLSDKSTRRWQMYRTSDVADENLKPVGISNGTVMLPPRSITTLVSAK